MKKVVLVSVVTAIVLACLCGCASNKTPKIGVSFGAGSATRWVQEKAYMEERAQELGAQIEVHQGELPDGKSQVQDCIDLINTGIDVLIIRPKGTGGMEEVVALAQEKGVKLINYAGLIENQPIDLFVGYDCTRIGQTMGKHLVELVPKGDYILLSGAPEDEIVSPFLYGGAMEYITPLIGDITILLDAAVPKWDPEAAKVLVRDAVEANGGRVDAILAPNDGIAGACMEVLAEMGVTQPVVITGMDAQLSAAQRIWAGTQSCTIYMDGRTQADIAVEEACKMARGEKVSANAEVDNGAYTVPANLITGQIVTKGNLERILIDGNVFTQEEIFGE